MPTFKRDVDEKELCFQNGLVVNVSIDNGDQLLNATKVFNQSLLCYEDNESDNALLINVDFWVSGVGISTIGIAGIIGNFLTLLALACESRENHNSFNK